MRTLIFITIIIVFFGNCSENNVDKDKTPIVDTFVGEKIPVNKSEYINFLIFKNSDTNYVYGKIKSGDKHFGDKDITQYSIGFYKNNPWTILQLDTTFSLLYYHSLIMWVDGLDNDRNIPETILGLSIHKSNKLNNYCFVVDKTYKTDDTEFGLFENGNPFSIYMPNAWEEKGNLYSINPSTIKAKNIQDFLKTYNFDINVDSVPKLTFDRTVLKVK